MEEPVKIMFTTLFKRTHKYSCTNKIPRQRKQCINKIIICPIES